MIGVIVALKSETTELTNFVSNVKPYSVSGYKCYIFNLLNKQVVLIYSGVGKANAAVAAHILVSHFNVNLVINAGFCGSLNNKNGIGQFVIPRFISYHDVDATAFNYEINQIPHEEKHYEVKNKLINNLTK
jgi:adenosylhomocysteine nucleosidase